MEFVEGGLYWHSRNGYVECVEKYGDVAVFKGLEEGSRLVALDGDEGYYEPNRYVMDAKVERVQEELDGLKEGVRKLEVFIGKLKYGIWANMGNSPVVTDPTNGLKWIDKGPVTVGQTWNERLPNTTKGRYTDGGWMYPTDQAYKIDISVSDSEFAKMNKKSVRNMSVFNTDTGSITEYAEDGTVKAVYAPESAREQQGTPETSCDGCEPCPPNWEWRTLYENGTPKEEKE